MSGSFSLKTIRLTITLGRGSFDGGGNTKIIEGLACEVTVDKPGLPDKSTARVKIWGLKYEDMAELTMLSFRPLESRHNTVEIEAGEQGGKLSLIFKGEITNAYADFNDVPDPSMRFEAACGDYPQEMKSSAITTNGEAPAADLFARFAADAGYDYKNECVTASVTNAWFPGSPMDKLEKLARDVECELIVDDGMVITLPSGKARSGPTVLLNKDTGLIGYPTFNQNGISCRCLFNPGLAYGGLIRVESMVPRASGVWRINRLSHNLSAYMPSTGNWESSIEAAYDA